jgi:hypothetical protein
MRDVNFMDVLLVQAPAQVVDECIYPIGLVCVGSIIKKEGHNIEIFDPNISKISAKQYL